MQLQFVRNATIRLGYAGRTLLIDPMLSPKGAMDAFAGGPRNPTVDLPMPAADVVAGIDAVVVSHAHPDHFDPLAAEALSKDVPVFAQEDCVAMLAEAGFTSVTPLAGTLAWEGITMVRTGGRHGEGEIGERMGTVSGVVLRADGEPTVYWAGDTILCDEVRAVLREHAPDVVVVHAGGAAFPGTDPIIMDAAQTIETAQLAPDATIVATHLESLDHCPVTRDALREAAESANVPGDRLRIPRDGETITL